MNDRMHIETFLAELDADIAGLDELVETNAKAAGRIRSGAGDDLDWAALGYTIYIYNTLESQPGIAGTKRLLAEKYLLFCRRFHRQETTSCASPTFFENDLPAATWRRELVDRMTLKIDGVRPRLLDRALAREIHELRAFRHVFRNIYGSRLDPESMRILQARVPASIASFRAAHAEFTGVLRDLADLIES